MFRKKAMLVRYRLVNVNDKDEFLIGSKSTDYESIARNIAKIIAIYMGCDTLRKIIVHTIATKIN